MQQNLNHFWTKYKAQFSEFWSNLPDAEKRGFLLASSPYMTESVGLQPTDLLMPEINVSNLTANLLKVMEYRAVTPLEDQESDDYQRIIELQQSNLLPDFSQGKKKSKGMEVYCPLRREALVVTDMNNTRVKEFLEQGVFVDMRLWQPLATRQFVTLQHLCLYADDYRREVLEKHGHKTAVGSYACKVCNAKQTTTGGQLLQCGRCRSVKYCSAECQRKDWPTHKLGCLKQ